jgi:hypothetical protein
LKKKDLEAAGVNRRAISFQVFSQPSRRKAEAAPTQCSLGIPNYPAQELFPEVARFIRAVAQSGENGNATEHRFIGSTEAGKATSPPNQFPAPAWVRIQYDLYEPERRGAAVRRSRTGSRKARRSAIRDPSYRSRHIR